MCFPPQADSIEETAVSWNVSDSFLSVFLLPVAGNAAEHWSAILFAAQNRLDATIAIAIGSATQIGLFVLPVTVIVAWCSNVPLSLVYQPFEMAAWIISILLVVAVVSREGKAHWLKGAILVACYAAVVVCFLEYA